MSKDKNEYLIEALSKLTTLIGKTFGPNCEVILHDLRDPNCSITAISNGHVTGREIGSPITNLGLKAVYSPNHELDEMINYEGRTPDGRPLKSSSIIFRDDDSTPIAGLCINFDITELTWIKSFVENFSRYEGDTSETEEFYPTMEQAFDNLIKRATEKINKPVVAMDKPDKKRVVALLDSWGVFLMKGSTEKVAEALGVSRFTIYNYLEEIKNKKSMF